jgi:hypothetical protein
VARHRRTAAVNAVEWRRPSPFQAGKGPWSSTDASVFVTDVLRPHDQQSCNVSQLIKNGAAANEALTSTTDATVGAQLDPGRTGTILSPRDPGWDEARTPWVVNVDQQPAAVALVRSVADVSAVVASAARSGLTVIAQGTDTERYRSAR